MRTVRHGATPDDALHAIEGYLQRDTPWEEVDKLIDIFAEKGGYEEKHIGTKLEIFTKLLGVEKSHPKYQTIKKRYYASRRQRVRGLRDEGLSQRAIGEKVGVSKRTVEKDLATHDKKGSQPQRTVYQVSNYTKPETAVQKLREKFGTEWFDAMVDAALALRRGGHRG